MNITQFLLVLRARWMAIVGVLAFCVLAALVVTLLMPKKYTATAIVLVDYKAPDLVTGALLPILPGYMATQQDIIQSPRVARAVVRKLKMADNPVSKQQFMDATEGRGDIEDWLAGALGRNLDVEPAKESTVINIKYTAPDARFASALANAFAQAYIDTNIALRVEPAKQTSEWFDDQAKALRDNLEAAQSKLMAYQREKGFTATEDAGDVENRRLSELNSQYTVVQGALADATSRQRQLEEFLANGTTPEALPDILANQLIQGLKTNLAQSLARLDQISSQLGRNHPEVRKLEADIAQQRQQLRAEINTVSASIGNAARLAQRREAELRQAVADQKAKLFRLNQGRDELSVLVRDVETAQRAYDLATQRRTTSALESQVNQTNVLMLAQAVEPIEPSSPNMIRNLILATFVGTLLGVAVAFALEHTDGRVRSVQDLQEGLGVTHLGTVRRSSEAKRATEGWRRFSGKKLRTAAAR